ncbi:hypothetical protein [Rhodococcus artemisiae]|uniref:Ig-like domain-containing protein n=1 Tax=Rhodococcus artemisiae TaxID=714159 RepID=A0ABU7LGL6_9NOCA|nr:hypothetical protein [Rhodococcus artemisiae]MEE2060382.1 hypothetical protein [Rhodococcus artemisiae]
MNSVAKKAALTAAGAAALAFAVPGVASAAGPNVSASADDTSITVDFDLPQDSVELGATCVTYVLEPGTVDTATPSGRIDNQPAGTKFSVNNTETSSATYVKDGAPAQTGARALTPGTYDVYWGCQDAAGTTYDNIFDASGRPFAKEPITVTVGGGEAAPAEGAPAESAPAAPAEGAPAQAGPVSDEPVTTPEPPLEELPIDPIQWFLDFIRDLLAPQSSQP